MLVAATVFIMSRRYRKMFALANFGGYCALLVTAGAGGGPRGGRGGVACHQHIVARSNSYGLSTLNLILLVDAICFIMT